MHHVLHNGSPFLWPLSLRAYLQTLRVDTQWRGETARSLYTTKGCRRTASSSIPFTLLTLGLTSFHFVGSSQIRKMVFEIEGCKSAPVPVIGQLQMEFNPEKVDQVSPSTSCYQAQRHREWSTHLSISWKSPDNVVF